MTPPGFDHIPERRENWAEAEFKGKAKSVITLRDGHVMISDEPPGFAGGFGGENAGPTPTGFLVAAFVADIPAMLNPLRASWSSKLHRCARGFRSHGIRAALPAPKA